MTSESFPQAITPEGQPSLTGVNSALVANGFAPEKPPAPSVEGASVEGPVFPTAQTIAGAVSEGVVAGLRAHAEAEQATQQAALVEARAAEARAAEASEAARKARISAMPTLKIDPLPKPTARRTDTAIVPTVNARYRVVDGVVVSGNGFVGTAEQAKRLREPDALTGPTDTRERIFSLLGQPGEIAFGGLKGRFRRFRAGRFLGQAFDRSMDSDVRREGTAGVVHGRPAIPSLRASTLRQESGVREAVDLVDDKLASLAQVRSSVYKLRSIARQAKVEGADTMTPDELIAALGDKNLRLSASAKKAIRVNASRLNGTRVPVVKNVPVVRGSYVGSRHHADHSAHALRDMTEGTDRRGRKLAALKQRSISDAQRLIDKQRQTERKAAIRAAAAPPRVQPPQNGLRRRPQP